MPDDGARFAPAQSIDGWKQRPDLPGIREFADADHVGADELPRRAAL